MEKKSTTANMDIYDAVRSVPEGARRDFEKNGFSGTEINPMYRIEVLTRQFGPAGIGWRTEVLGKWTETAPDGSVNVFMEINLFVKVGSEWSHGIYGVGGHSLTRMKDEAYKCAYTDALSVACKALGIGADVYYANSEGKYREHYVKETQRPAAPAALAPVAAEVTEPDLFSEAEKKSAAPKAWPWNRDFEEITPTSRNWGASVTQVSSELGSTLDDLLERMQSRFNITRTNWQRLVKASGRSSEMRRS